MIFKLFENEMIGGLSMFGFHRICSANKAYAKSDFRVEIFNTDPLEYSLCEYTSPLILGECMDTYCIKKMHELILNSFLKQRLFVAKI